MKWDLTYLFKTEEEFSSSIKELSAMIDQLASYKGRLGVEEDLVEYLKLSREFNIKGEKTYQYASLRSDLDKRNVANAASLNEVRNLFYRLSALVSFEEPELIKLGKDYVMGVIERHQEVGEYRFLMQKLFDSASHILSDSEEYILSQYSPLANSGAELYSALAVADGKPAIINVDGKELKVTSGSWRLLIQDAKTESEREAIFNALYQNYEAHKTTYATIYNSVLEADVANARCRSFESSLAAHLEGNQIPLSVYHNLVEVAGHNNESVKKYYALVKDYLGLSKFHTYDRFLPLASSDKRYTYEEAKQLFFTSIEHFSEDFQAKAHEVLRDGFVDVYEQDGKRSGAYSSGSIDLHPYILLNHDGTLDSVFTVAHEAGHSIHSLYSCEAQPSLLQNYTIFVAEIASTFNEHNLLDYFLTTNASKEEKIMVIQKAIEEILATFYRQTLFAEYELKAHEIAEAGGAINHEVLSNIMKELYMRYYGINLDDEPLKKYVWCYIPHLFYTPFYVYQYATSFSASFALYKKVKEEGAPAFERYLGLLKSGGSKYPMEEALDAGVDFTKKEAFMAVVERLDYLVDELEKLLK